MNQTKHSEDNTNELLPSEESVLELAEELVRYTKQVRLLEQVRDMLVDERDGYAERLAAQAQETQAAQHRERTISQEFAEYVRKHEQQVKQVERNKEFLKDLLRGTDRELRNHFGEGYGY